MTSPTFSDFVSNSDTSGTTKTVSYPATVPAGVWIVCHFGCDGPGQTITFPGDWTALVSAGLTGSQAMAIYYKASDGSEGGSTFNVDITASHDGAWHVYLVNGADMGTAPEVTTAGISGSPGVNPTPPTATPSWGTADTLYVAMFGAGVTDGTVTTSGYPSGYSNLAYTNSNSSAAIMVAIASKETTASASDSPSVFTISVSSTNEARVLMFKPDPGGTSDPFVTVLPQRNIRHRGRFLRG